MNGARVIGGGAIGTLAGGWSIAGLGDFSGDGMTDLLLTHANGDGTTNLAQWRMNGTGVTGGARRAL